MTPDQLAIHTFTNQPWSVFECVENYARAGIGGISVWKESVVGRDLATVRRRIRDSGLSGVAYVRGGFFTATDAAGRTAKIAENLEIIADCEALGLPTIVIVGGATIGQSPAENLAQIADGLAAVLPRAAAAGIRLSIEPLHPLYAGDRCAVSTVADAEWLCQQLGDPALGIAVDPYHVFWDRNLESDLARCGQAGLLHSLHLCDFLPDLDHPLLSRGLPGEGVAACARVARATVAAGFRGLAEVEIFSRVHWARNQHDFLADILASCADLPGPPSVRSTHDS